MYRTTTATPELTRQLRRNASPAKRLLWEHLRAHGLEGLKFRRQHAFGPYVLDFYCPQLGISIDIEEPGQPDDKERIGLLERRGLRILTFRETEVLRDTAGVLAKLRSFVVDGVLPSTDGAP